MNQLATLLLLCVPVLAAPPRPVPDKSAPALDRRPLLLRAIQEEVDRTRARLRLPDFEPPYFAAFEIKDMESIHLEARHGAIYQNDRNRNRRLRTEIRVGSYAFDNVGTKAMEYDFSSAPGYMAPRIAPLDDDPIALRTSLWLLADENYKSALKAYLKRKSKKVTEVDDGKSIASFSQEPPSSYIEPPGIFSFDVARAERMARSASAVFERHPKIFDSYVTCDASRTTRYLVNSEGTRLATSQTFYSLTVFAVSRAEDGMLLTNQRTLYAQREDELPSDKEILALVETVAAEIEALGQAPVLDPYTGPAILDGEATGVLFHEVIGHRLEGERQLDDDEGRTFKGQVGNRIIPEFMSVVDDPTLENLNGKRLNGFYRFDDEGVPAQRVVLIDHGVLKSFLMSRTPVEGFARSNGHGRAAAGEKPRARMANTIVLSERQVPFGRLKEMLIEEVRRQGKPYGLIIRSIVGGETHTSTWGFQAYKGVPQLTYRVFPDGREELVRGVEIVGTPLVSINKIIATSDRTATFNGFCGAESGYVPVSASAPDVLVSELELQRSAKKSEKPPILPAPGLPEEPRPRPAP